MNALTSKIKCFNHRHTNNHILKCFNFCFSMISSMGEFLDPLFSLPYDPTDSKYVLSFNPNNDTSISDNYRDIEEFFNRYGFVVLRGIYNPSQCSLTRSAMWDISEGLPENSGMKRDDPRTWMSLKSKGKYGLSLRGPTFHPVLVDNRQNETLLNVLSVLTGAHSSRDVIVSQDRFTIYRATKIPDHPEIPAETFSTGAPNLHLDMSPWWYEEDASVVKEGIESLKYEDAQDFIKENNLYVKSMGRHVQCVLNFMDNEEDDGGTIVIPKFHSLLSSWAEQHQHLRKSLPWVTLPRDLEKDLLRYARRITMREGSVLVWDQRVIHGTSPNNSTRCRLAQYLKACPRHATYPLSVSNRSNERLVRRAEAIMRFISQEPFGQTIVTEAGKYAFGLDVLPAT